MERKYSDAVAALNTLQSNFAVVDAIRKSGRSMNQQAIPEMIEWCRKAGYQPADFDRLSPIHIAGTKGKGSTSAFVASILSQYLPQSSSGPATSASDSGTRPLQKVGLYTSPHLRFVRERIQVNNAPLTEEVFARYFFEIWDKLEESAREAGLPTGVSAKPVYFRYLTLMALHAYLEEGVDTAVIEVGIGGEHDSTNILAHPTVTGITSLGIDHTAMLGNTIEEIAWHKAGIFKPGAAALTVPQPDGAMRVLRQRAEERGVRLEVVDRHPDLETITLGLAADFQKTNASLAIAIAAAHLRARGYADIPSDISTTSKPLPPEFRRGLEQVRWPGRCEIRRGEDSNITWCIDSGHTLESIEVAGKWFTEQISSRDPAKVSPKRVLIFNQQKRDAKTLARTLHQTLIDAIGGDVGGASPFTHVIFCSNVTFRDGGYKPDLVSLNADTEEVDELSVQKALAESWRAIQGEQDTEVTVLRTIEDAVGQVKDLAKNEESVTVLVTGSLHLVGGFLEVLES